VYALCASAAVAAMYTPIILQLGADMYHICTFNRKIYKASSPLASVLFSVLVRALVHNCVHCLSVEQSQTQ
jgi:hypothetical protein